MKTVVKPCFLYMKKKLVGTNSSSMSWAHGDSETHLYLLRGRLWNQVVLNSISKEKSKQKSKKKSKFLWNLGVINTINFPLFTKVNSLYLRRTSFISHAPKETIRGF